MNVIVPLFSDVDDTPEKGERAAVSGSFVATT